MPETLLPGLSLIADAHALAPRIVALRRAIHAEPELGLMTPKTRDKVRGALAHLPLEWREGPSTTGLVARLKGGAGSASNRAVLLRGDMDALPMPEETGLPFASRIEGAMHACGHDAHTAMLAGAAELLCARAAHLPGDVLFMFQPGEEGWHGARHMLDDGLLEWEGRSLPDSAFALHVMRRRTRSGSSSKGAGGMPRCRIRRSTRCRSPARSSWRSRPW